MLSPFVPNSFPARAGARRIAIVGESPGTSERSWVKCPSCAHAFASEYTDARGTRQHWTRCERCGCADLKSAPTPLVGPSGRLLNKLLDEVGIRRDECFVGNVSQIQPPRNEISRFKWTGPEIQEGMTRLREDLATFQPHFILCLGGTALRAFRGAGNVDDSRGYAFTARDLAPGVKALATYHPARLLRESGLTGIARFDFRKAAREARTDTLEFAPRQIDIDLTPDEMIARLASLRASRQRVALDIEGGVEGIACIGFATSPVSAFVIPFASVTNESLWDEETEIRLVEAVCALLTDPLVPKIIMNALYELFVIAWTWGVVIEGLTDDIMLKHFELYCEFEKSLEFQASLYCNVPYWKLSHKRHKGFYVPHKDGAPATSADWYRYNGMDCCVTFECDAAQEKLLAPRQREHYAWNVSMLAPVLYQMLRGIKYDCTQAQKHKKAVEKRIYALQDRINREAAAGGKRQELVSFLAACEERRLDNLLPFLVKAFCAARRVEKREVEETTWQPMRFNGRKWVKAGARVKDRPEGQEVEGGHVISGETTWNPVAKVVLKNFEVPVTTLKDVRRFARDSVKARCRRASALIALLVARPLLPARRGELATLLDLSVKIRASGRDRDEEDASTGELVRGDERDANWFLYEHCGLPKQYVKEGNRLTDRLASDAEAVIKAWIQSSKHEKSRDRRALWFAALKSLLTEARSLAARPDDDGRIRSSINLVGTETHRLSNSGSPTHTSKLNLQTITKSHRYLYRADDSCYLAQRDLSGADGWTVAAYCAKLGDRNMLDDYLAKLKPAQIITLMLKDGSAVNKLTRDQLKPLCKPITEETHWQYFAMKRGQHGWSYRMGDKTTSDQILTDSIKKSGKPIFIAPKECARLRDTCFFVRYPGIPRMHDYFRQLLLTDGALTACNGFTRRFYGRKDEDDTLRQAIAHLPQVHTTYATMLALRRLWADPENRHADGSLIIEPLHTVHDSLISQWPQEVTEWARGKLKEWFNNPLEIAGTNLVIPASGTYGVSWGEQTNEI